MVLVAKTDPNLGAKGTSLIIVEANTKGFNKGRNLKKLGLDSGDTAELFFDDCVVQRANLLGPEEGKGFIQLMQQLPQDRLSLAQGAVVETERADRPHVRMMVSRTQIFDRRVSCD